MPSKSSVFAMKSSFAKLWICFLLVTAVLGANVYASSARTGLDIAQAYLTDASGASYQAYEEMHRAEVDGANVTSLVPVFNSGLDTLKHAQEEFKRGNVDAAASNAKLARDTFIQIRDTAGTLRQQALLERSRRTVITLFVGSVIVAIVTLTSYGLLRVFRVVQWRKLMGMEIRLVPRDEED